MTDLLTQLKPWLAWMQYHPEWVGVITFIITFVECLAVVGLLVPGTVLMTTIGALIGSDVVSAQVVFLPALLGAILGDAISFFIGYHYHERLRDLWPFKGYPRLLQSGESFFYRHGGKGIFAGRFLGPIRPVLPIIAGMLNMKPWRFFLADITSAVFWVPLYMLPGILLGAASTELAPGVALHLILYVIFILLILWCISWLIKRMTAWVFLSMHNALDQVWKAIKHKSFLRPLSIALQDPVHPESHNQLTLCLYGIIFAALFITLAINVYYHGCLTAWNNPLLYLLRSLHNTITTHVTLLLTILSEPTVMAGVYLAVLAWLIWQRAWSTAAHWFVLGLLSFGSQDLFKLLVHSTRPGGLVVVPTGFSFPSGHTASFGTIAGFFAILLAHELKKTNRWIPYAFTTTFLLGAAFSRLYLGAHWLTDVIGSILLSAVILTGVTLSYHRKFRPKLPIKPFLTVFLLSWALMASAFGLTHYQHYLHNTALYIPSKTIDMDHWWQCNGRSESLYRLDRTGKFSQILNVQWAGDLNEIEQSLIEKGWVTTSNTTLSIVLARISKQPNSFELPLLPQLYLDQRPVLVMTKELSSPHTVLLLSLWDGKTTFSESDTPLWLGNISYYHTWQSGLFHLRPSKIVLPTQIAMTSLEMDLSHFTWKQAIYPYASIKIAGQLSGDVQVLLVKPKISSEGNN